MGPRLKEVQKASALERFGAMPREAPEPKAACAGYLELVCRGVASVASLTSRAQRKPIQFILVLGSDPLRCAPRTLGVLSIQPPPRKLRCVPFSSPLRFLSGAVAYTPEDKTGLTHGGKSHHRALFTFYWNGYERTSTPAPE